MFLEDDEDEVRNGCPNHKSLGESSSLIKLIAQQDDEDEHLEDSHGCACDIAECRSQPSEQIHDHRVGREREDRVMDTEEVLAVVHEVAILRELAELGLHG